MAKIIAPLILALLFTLAFFLDKQSVSHPVYLDLPTVPCFDPNLPVEQDYSLHISLEVNGKNYPLEADIGHDYGQCLRVIHTDNASGSVKVKANDSDQYSLGQFFQVWHKQFNMGYHEQITVNGQKVNTGASTPLKANEQIKVIYTQNIPI